MMKLLQKYKMQILVVVGIFVMIAFLLSDAIKQVTQYAMENKRYFTVDGEKITQAQHQAASMHFDGLKRVVGQDQLLRPLGLDDSAEQWHLAAIAAQRAGVVGGPADGRATVRMYALQMISREAASKGFNDWRAYLKQVNSITDEQVEARVEAATDSILSNTARSGSASSEGANAFAEYHGLLRLLRSYGDVPQTSENRLATEARRLLDVATLKYIYVPITQARIDAAPAPTPQELQAQFDKFKDTPVGTGEGGAGYRQNDRITYSWFAIDKQVISKAVRVDPIEVSKRALDRASGDKVEPNLRSQIESEIRGELTQRALDDLTSAPCAEFLKQSALLPEKDGYKVLPSDWKKPDLTAAVANAVARLATEKKVTIPAPQVNSVTTLQDPTAFMAEKGIGFAMLPRRPTAGPRPRRALCRQGVRQAGRPRTRAGRRPDCHALHRRLRRRHLLRHARLGSPRRQPQEPRRGSPPGRSRPEEDQGGRATQGRRRGPPGTGDRTGHDRGTRSARALGLPRPHARHRAGQPLQR
ncbi:MAG: hypothetical protein QM783_08735 [Phycisphaerales bacterium]